MPILIGISRLRLIREGSGFASACLRNPGDSAMLESCRSRPSANREGIRLRRCPVGSNAQVPANWAFLQILAQSRNNYETMRFAEDRPSATSIAAQFLKTAIFTS